MQWNYFIKLLCQQKKNIINNNIPGFRNIINTPAIGGLNALQSNWFFEWIKANTRAHLTSYNRSILLVESIFCSPPCDVISCCWYLTRRTKSCPQSWTKIKIIIKQGICSGICAYSFFLIKKNSIASSSLIKLSYWVILFFYLY